jgi:hypothetical protein
VARLSNTCNQGTIKHFVTAITASQGLSWLLIGDLAMQWPSHTVSNGDLIYEHQR